VKTLTHAALTITLFASHCLCIGCTTAASDKSQGMTDERDNPVKEVVGDMEGDYKKADAQHEDIIDRAFAPLDDTVSDINRDLNDKSGDSAIPKTSD
jgi:hypothetical protein